jgi:hypothetical protein
MSGVIDDNTTRYSNYKDSMQQICIKSIEKMPGVANAGGLYP